MLVDIPFIKVVLLRCDVFETTIADERNFNSYAEAKAYADLHSDLVPCIIEQKDDRIKYIHWQCIS